MSRYLWASRCNHVLLPTALWILLGVPVQGASITNRNLETWSSGSPTGWTTQGLVQSMTSWTFEPQILPAQGTYSAALSTNLQAGDQYDSGFDLDGNGQHELDVATMSQTFDTLAGDLTFKINFLTSDGGS